MNLRTLCLLLLWCGLPCAPSAGTAAPPQLMHATTYTTGVAVSQYWVSEKLDGVRGHWDGRRLRTRSGLAIDAPAWFTANWPAVPMDGELWIARGRFEQVSAIVRTAAPGDAAWRQVRFMVFDLPAHRGPFQARVVRMRTLLDAAAIAWLRPLAQFRVGDAGALDARLAAVVAKI